MTQAKKPKKELIEKKVDKKIKKPLVDELTKKEFVKVAMTVTMGLTVLSAFNTRNKIAKKVHIVSGALLVGFSFYHNFLYDKPKKSES